MGEREATDALIFAACIVATLALFLFLLWACVGVPNVVAIEVHRG